MRTAFDTLPDSARLWIYQASRQLTYPEAHLVRVESRKFANNWQAHGQSLKSDVSVLKNQFLVLAVDESFSVASGCSIDASVNLVKNLSSLLGVDFLDRKNVAFLIDDSVQIFHLNEINDLVEQKVIVPETMVFNNVVQNLGEWKSSWLIPCAESWVNKYFK